MAQTYTHAIGGVVIAQTAITFDIISVGQVFSWPVDMLWLWAIGFTGAIVPDIPAFIYLIYDKLRGVHPFTQQGPIIQVFIGASHSLLVWVLALVIVVPLVPHTSVGSWILLFFFCVLVAGVLPDIPTHSEERFRETDPSFIYPLELLFPTWAIRWPSDAWEYRIDHGILWPLKPWELGINLVMIVIIALELLLLFAR